MSNFNIGQYIGDNQDSKTPLELPYNYTIDKDGMGIISITSENGAFEKNKEYLSIISLESIGGLIQTVNIYLTDGNEKKYFVYNGTIFPSQQKDIIFSFTPIEEGYNAIVIENADSNFLMQGYGLYYGSNIIDELDGITSLKKIGIQANPDSVFLINGEVITVGQSGIYEFLNGLVDVYSIAPISIEGTNFILDYQY